MNAALPRNWSRCCDGGFAMIEAVAVLFLSSLLFVMLTVAGGFLFAHAARTSDSVNETEMLIGGVEAWQREISQAANPAVLSGDGSEIVFIGSPEEMALVSSLRGLDAPVEIVRFGTEGSRLTRRAREMGQGAVDLNRTAGGPQTILLDGDWLYRFDYRAREPENGRWSSGWNRAGRLPGAVRLTILDRGTQTPVMTAIAEPKVNGVAECLSDACAAEDGEGGDANR